MLSYIIIYCKSENRNNGAHWLLYDNVHCHFLAITDIRKLLGASFYCNAYGRVFQKMRTHIILTVTLYVRYYMMRGFNQLIHQED
jgi:hypothetical protein